MTLLNETTDQFVFSGPLNPGGMPDFIGSRQIVNILRNLRKHAPIGEGNLAAKCRRQVYDPGWKRHLETLATWGYIQITSKEHGNARLITMSVMGESWAKDHLSPEANLKPLTEV